MQPGDGDALSDELGATLPTMSSRALVAPSVRGELGHAVGPGAVVVAAVERAQSASLVEPVVGAAVDDERVVVELRGDLAGLAVRQGEEDDVVAARISAVVSTSIRCASERRCGCVATSGWPAF